MNSMTNKIDISILVVTYNPIWANLKKTLYSIIIQKKINFEIVISDDGSKENYFNEIKQYFAQNNIINFKLVANSQNKGTVKNMISGLEVCSGEYVKDISPGDFLYDENTLFNLFQKIKIDKKDLYFANSIYYSFEERQLSFYDIRNPRDIEPYILNDEKKIIKNYLIRHDYILGASVIIKTNTFLNYLKKLEQTVIYAEDCSFIYMVAEGIIPIYLNETILWYEYGTGVSTSLSPVWNKRLYDDNKNTFELLLENKLIQKEFYELYYSDNILKRIILLFFLNPFSIFNKLLPPKKLKHLMRDDSEKILSILRTQ